MKILFLVFNILYLFLHLAQGGNQPKSVLLEDVRTLTLQRGQRTQAKRVSSIPQLKCIGGSAQGAYEPDTVQCYNRGSNGVDIQWECTAEMPNKYKFGRLSVSCEGYNYPEDPYILAGSCGLEYHLELNDKNAHDSRYSSNVQHSSTSRIWSFLFKVALIVTIFFIVKSFIAGGNRTGAGGVRPMGTGPDHRPPGGGGGGGWFSNFFPGGAGGFGRFGGFGGAPGAGDTRRRPPPPGFRVDDAFDDASCNTNRPQNAPAGGTTNFLTGAALGALGGYLFGNRNQRTNTQYTPGTANTGWFGGGAPTTDTYRRSPTSSPSSGSTHTSSGFGGTTRR